MTFEILRIGPADAILFDRIAPDVFDAPVRTDRLAAYLAEPGHCMILARADGQVAGQCAAVIHRHPDKEPELFIDEVGTALGYRRRGIARAMIAAMLDWGRELGCGCPRALRWQLGTARAGNHHIRGRPLTFVMLHWTLVRQRGA